MNILFPGRHLVTTTFQDVYLRSILGQAVSAVETIGPTDVPNAPKPTGTLDTVVYAITSANLDTVRYSSVPLTTRMSGINAFASHIQQNTGTKSFIVPVPHFKSNGKFADYTLKEISEQTDGFLQLIPQNTVVLCSTPEVIKMYAELGFTILPAELSALGKEYIANSATPLLPRQIIEQVVTSQKEWYTDSKLLSSMHASTAQAWKMSPWIVDRIKRIWKDPLLTDTGDLTTDRDYATYTFGMSNPVILDVKYTELKPFIREGRVVDEGCADGALLQRIARDFPDSDLLGVDITSAFIERCKMNQKEGRFGGSYIHFHERNILDKLFDDNSIDTTLCNSTLHELWSYAEQEHTIDRYLSKKFAQLRPGGILAVRDVVGPDNGDDEVYLWCNMRNGVNENPLQVYADKKDATQHLSSLSTYSRFIRFAQDYLREMRENGRRDISTQVQFDQPLLGESYVRTSRRVATEFMTKMSYVDNWASEMNEEFAFFTLADWKQKLQQHGFAVVLSTTDNQEGTRSYTSPWTAKNIWDGNVRLFTKPKTGGPNGGLVSEPYPVTNMVLVGQKPK